MNVCISIAPRSMEEAIQKLKASGAKSNLVEVRIDGIKDIDFSTLLRKPRPRVIITNRRTSEGGFFRGSPAEQWNIFSQAMSCDAEYVDVEMSWGNRFIEELLARKSRTKIIVSYHNFLKTPRNLNALYEKMRGTGAQIIKIATMAGEIGDNKRIFDLVRRAREDHQKVIALCMGERGQISRVLSPKVGGFLTYASLTAAEVTAPGQLTVDDLTKIFRINSLNFRTRIFGLVGNPVSQSKGIFFHNALFKRKNVNAVYANFLVDNLRTFLTTFRDELSGFSVTMPYKEQIVPFLDSLEGETLNLKAVNTVLNSKGMLHGFNTDLSAIVSLLKSKTKLSGKRAVVLGAGGTSKTMAFAVVSNGGRTTVVARSPEKAEKLARELGCSWTSFEEMHAVEADIILNGTPVGMHPETDPVLVPKRFLRKGMIVLDAVYQSRKTRLVADAEAAGCEIITGIELFRKQAQLQSRLFLQNLA